MGEALQLLEQGGVAPDQGDARARPAPARVAAGYCVSAGHSGWCAAGLSQSMISASIAGIAIKPDQPGRIGLLIDQREARARRPAGVR